MSKKYTNHDAYFRYSSSDDDDSCITERMSSSSSEQSSKLSERCNGTGTSSVKRKCEFSQEINIKHPEEIMFEDRRGQFPFMDGLNSCEARIRNETLAKNRSPRQHLRQECKEVSSEKTHREISNYPCVPVGVVREKVCDESFVQPIVEKDFPPCPGLERVTEIRGIKHLLYFCHLCNASCGRHNILHHLKGFNHQLNCLKALCPNKYHRIKDLPKKKSKKYVLGLLRFIQDREGIGKIIVEKDYLIKVKNESERNASLHSLDIPGTSWKNRKMASDEIPTLTSDLPDLEKYDYFCLVCECSVNDLKIWRSHGRKNKLPYRVRKYPKNKAPKTKSVYMPTASAFLIDRAEDHDKPVVGLNYIREMKHTTDNKETYHCFLCGECLTCINILSHTETVKHRTNYHQSQEV